MSTRFEQRMKQDEALSTAQRALRAAKNVGLRIHRVQLPRMAAALSYRTLFAIIPTFVIGVAVLGLGVDKQTVQETIDQLFEFTGIDRIVLSPAPLILESGGADPVEPEAGANERPPSVEPAQVQPSDQPVAESADEQADQAEGQARLDEWVDSLVTGVEGEQGRLKAVGAVGGLALVYAALGFLIEIERAFNSIYRARDGRSWSRRFTTYTTVLVVGPVCLLLTFILGGQLASAFEQLGNWTGVQAPVLASLTVRTTGVLISTLLFVLVYRVIPNTRVHLGPALAGAFFAAVAWEIAKFGLVQYIGTLSGGVARLYGAIGLIPIFMLWVYVTWLIVLGGLQFSFLMQHRREMVTYDASAEWRVVDPAAALAVAAHAARCFGEGSVVHARSAGRAAGLDDDLAQAVLEMLQERGLLHRVEEEDAGRQEAFALAEDPDGVPASAVLEAGFAMAASRVAPGLRDAQLRSLQGVTLSRFADENPPR